MLRSSLFKIDVVREGGMPIAVVATGAGYGHGVGLCQWGALEMARRGNDFRSILGHYFAGIEPQLYRYPAVDPLSFRRSVVEAFGPPP